MAEHSVNIAESLNITVDARASVRSNFAINHLRAATQAARNAYGVEQANTTADHGPWFEDMMLSVPVSVIMAAAALEVNANEIIQDILDGSVSLPFTNGCKLLLSDLKKENSGNTCDKYRRLALLSDKQPGKGTVAWQDADLLIKFRNALMHFKPAWDHEEDVHNGNLVKGLKTRMPVYRAYETSFQFPYGFMTYACAKWSVTTVRNFSKEFSNLLGISDRFAAPHLNFQLP